MRHCGTQLLETERLILRRFEIGDAEAMYKNWASDSEVTKYLTWPDGYLYPFGNSVKYLRWWTRESYVYSSLLLTTYYYSYHDHYTI